MGNGVAKLTVCFSTKNTKRRRRRRQNVSLTISEPSSLHENLGHSFFYIRPAPTATSPIIKQSNDDVTQTTFYSISGASISANTSTASSTSLTADTTSSSIPYSSVFESSDSFASVPLQAIPRGSSGPIERGFLSGPIDCKQPQRSSSFNGYGDEIDSINKKRILSLNLQWAQGKAGEDRVHIMISEKTGWVFVGIYDGFNGPDAPDFLLHNLYSAVRKELEGLLWNDDDDFEEGFDDHTGVLAGLSEALKKTEEAFLETAEESPEVAMMGSCVLAMLMRGDDIYLMNVGDSRAVLSRKLDDVVVENTNRQVYDGEEGEDFPSLTSLQLTMDHSTNVQEEVKRIKEEHPDDNKAISKGRVKGSVKVTRAFGAGFLKQPKWNNAVLEAFRLDYIGDSPYLSCTPSLFHHKLSPVDRFLILSSDGLYEYFTNEEAIAEVQSFITVYPTEDPAQHLIEEVLHRAAKRAGMDFYELLDIPQGERRRYHDDVTPVNSIRSFTRRRVLTGNTLTSEQLC
ncbi:hypothetical protein ACFE04_012321 [Oxalis oulophora]